MKALKLLSIVAAAAALFGLAQNFGDMRRYLKIEMM